jgi:hypothetical protein
MAITIPLTAILLVAVAAALGTLARWVASRLGAVDWLSFFLALLVFGLILLFGKVT